MSWAMSRGVVELPDGTRLRGRGYERALRTRRYRNVACCYTGHHPAISRGRIAVRCHDFWLPSDRSDARASFAEAHQRAATGERVEIVCLGGRGRTGTVIACIAQLGGVSAEDAGEWTREAYDRPAVETPWHRRYVRRFTPG